MRSSRVRALEVLSISALDLFASALGIFILMALFLFPFYLKEPAVEAALDAAEAESAEAMASMSAAQQQMVDAETRRAEAEARREQALAELAEAEEEMKAADAAARIAAAARARAPDAQPRPPAPAPREGTLTIGDLDLVFVMDATGSMRDEIADMQRTMLSIIRVLERLAPSLRVGFVAFKDRTDEYITQGFPLSPMTSGYRRQLEGFVGTLRAKGGGDNPEPVGRALASAIGMAWRPTALGRIIVISDAPAHLGDWQSTFNAAANWRMAVPGGGRDRRVSAIFTGRSIEGAQFYQMLAAAGGGEVLTHRGEIMESVLLSVLDGARLRRSRDG